MNKLTDFTALELREMIKRREISSRELCDAFNARIAEKDKEINAYVTLNESPEFDGDGVLGGVPIAVKDNICTKGLRTTCSSRILSNYVPAYDATVVERLKANGMPIIGKLNMDEFAMGSTNETSFFGPVKNPNDISRVPGGSSGGAAAAVAAGEAVCALGSDTGGSIRQPASYCGVTGFKPTYGLVSRYGLIAYASSLDQIGPIARDARDCAALMDVIAGHDAHDSTSLNVKTESFLGSIGRDIRGKRIGVPSECFSGSIDAEIVGAIKDCIKTLEGLGAEIVPVNLDFMDYVVPTYYIIATAEASSNLSRFDGVKYGYRAENVTSLEDLYYKSRSEGFGKEVQLRILLGTFVLSSGFYDAYYKKALALRQKIKAGYAEAFKKCDVIICPTSPIVAPKLGESLSDAMKMYLSDIFTVPVNLAGLPALNVPCGYTADGLPIGVQFIGNKLKDAEVLNIGDAYQQVTVYHKRRLN